MTQAERILIRWLSAIGAGIGVAATILSQATSVNINPDILLAVVIISAVVQAVVAALTTSTVSEAMGIRGR